MDQEQAEDDIYAMFFAAWTSGAFAVVGYVPEVRWPRVKNPDPRPIDKAWANVSIAFGRSDLSIGENTPGNRLATRMGILTVQIYTPQIIQGSTAAGRLAKLTRRAYEGQHSPNGVWFRNVQVTDRGGEAPWDETRVLSEFEFSEEV